MIEQLAPGAIEPPQLLVRAKRREDRMQRTRSGWFEALASVTVCGALDAPTG